MAERNMAEHEPRGTEARMIAEARRAFFVIFGFLCLIWVVQLGNWADDEALVRDYGIRPHDLLRLPDIFTAPLLHVSWEHLQSNSGPLFIFGFLAAYRGVKKFLLLTLLITVTSGLAVWVISSSDGVTVGASGLVFGYLGYVVLRGLFDRHLIDALIGVVMAASFSYELSVAVPGAPNGVSWQAHLGGLVGGVVGAWLLRERAARATGEPSARPNTAGASTAGPDGAGRGTPAKPAGVELSPRSELLKELDDLGL
ncbi:rhomboid family intramembrane serine protease [Kitasatospora sp. NBC_01287]|uniref:rhomboid family intramembrane serine protease n=1 Tax=Kitasatospora sp. NBC_01287 TaxID=2903573 RepID=UPI00224E4830|nr:rhomboid family intramembrane serine protease [Kitasatospora sp. NBC_01287]MCX4747969.1 rhomboid family intramembrane serine protease [Kitasatospora sp. NBC_01287]